MVERLDPKAAERQPIFSQSTGASEGAAAQQDESKEEETAQVEVATSEGQDPMKKLKMVTEDLLDLWLHEGSRGL